MTIALNNRTVSEKLILKDEEENDPGLIWGSTHFISRKNQVLRHSTANKSSHM